MAIALTHYDLNGGSTLICDVRADGELLHITLDRRDADNVALMLTGGKLKGDDREAMAKLAELIKHSTQA